jgi:hypothetical protein
MNTYRKQQGLATILLVLLIGLTVMLLTAAVAKNLTSKKEASVSAHAQTNAQLMGWAGVSAFREYLLKEGQANLANLAQLNGQSVTLRNDPNFKEIVAKSISVSGCSTANAPCIISAEINAHNKTSQAASTIQATYELDIGDGTVQLADETTSLNFTGHTSFSGTTLEAEVPNSHVVLNVDGRTEIHAGFRTKNIDLLTINSTGDVIIDCSYTKCGDTKINVNARGSVHITHPGKFGTIYSKDWVKLLTGVKADEIYATGNVSLALNSSAKLIHSGGDVTISEGASAEIIHTKGDVILRTAATANQVYAQGKVELYLDSEVTGHILAGKHIILSASRVRGDAKAYDYVSLDTGSHVYGSVYAKGLKAIPLSNNAIVRLSTSKVHKNIYSGGRISLLDGLIGEDVYGDVYLTNASIFGQQGVAGSVHFNVNPMTELDFTVPDVVDLDRIRTHVEGQLGFKTRIDVRKYKQDANYIFTQDTKVARVFLNHLRNEHSQITYMYEDGKQYAVDQHNNKTLINSKGFYLGKYVHGGETYVGAICETIDFERTDLKSGKCTSSIVGYLPRVSVESKIDILGLFGIPHDYHHTYTRLGDALGVPLHTWYVRSISAPSSFENATLAPGIMYFEGDLSMAGEANWKADSSSNVFTNTFLAEGDIAAIALSPRIYSPYNVIREGNADIICSRRLTTATGATPTATTPITLSHRYLTPVNLCKNDNEFRYDMSRDQNGAKTQLNIDGDNVDKLDLGYVALMSNRIIRIGACAQIFGDVLAKSNVETTAACGLNAQPNKIVGSISTQGTAPYIDPVKQITVFAAGTNLVVPDPDFTNFKNQPGGTVNTGTTLRTSTLKWAKYR